MPPSRRNAPTPTGKMPTIQSLQRGLGILELVARKGGGVSMAEISRQVGLHTSTTFHLLRTLSALGFLQQDETTKQYFPGSKIFHLAAAASTEVQLLNLASPLLAELARETGEASHLAVLERGEVIVLAKVDGSSRVGLSDRVGYPRPAHCTAIGKVLLASLAEADLDALLKTAELPSFTAKTITSAAQLRQELDRVRAQGYAFDDEEFVQGIRCLASGVRNFSGRVVGAVGISGPVWRVSLDRVAPLTGLVMEAARRLSHSLGHTRTETGGGNGSSP
ncbi:MAG: IclR family transcriptional regulator [Candidatus Methylomirabilales bacterium]